MGKGASIEGVRWQCAGEQPNNPPGLGMHFAESSQRPASAHGGNAWPLAPWRCSCSCFLFLRGAVWLLVIRASRLACWHCLRPAAGHTCITGGRSCSHCHRGAAYELQCGAHLDACMSQAAGNMAVSRASCSSSHKACSMTRLGFYLCQAQDQRCSAS